MAIKVLVKPIVFIDAEETVAYYEEQLEGLGKKFYEKLLFTIDRIQSAPFSFSFAKEPVRRCLIKGFPFKIFYIISEETIIIIGITHVKRSNRFIKKKLGL